MLYQTFLNRYEKDKWLERYPTWEAYMKRMAEQMENEHPSPDFDKLFEDIQNLARYENNDEPDEARDTPALKPFKKIPAAERQTRHDLSLRLRNIYTQHAAAKLYSNIPSAGTRYLEDIVMERHRFPEAGRTETPEMREYNRQVDERNRHLVEICKDAVHHRSEVLDVYVNMFKKWEDFDPLALADHPLSDEELVDNFDRIHYIAAMTGQIPNIEADLKKFGVDYETLTAQIQQLESKEVRTDEETAELQSLRNDIKKLDYMKKVSDAYFVYGESVYEMEARLSDIESPYYELLDLDDLETRRTFEFWRRKQDDLGVEIDVPGDQLEDKELFVLDPQTPSKHIMPLLENADLRATYFWISEYKAVKKSLVEQGTAPEDIVFKIGEDGEELSAGSSENQGIDGQLFKKSVSAETLEPVTIYDKNHPERAVTLSLAASTPEIMKMAGQQRENTFPPLPTPPAFMEEPVNPTPNTAKRFWNTMTFGSAYKTENDLYERYLKPKYEQEKKEYALYLRRMERYNRDRARVLQIRETYVKNHPEDQEAGRLMELQETEPAVLHPANVPSPEAVEAKTRRVAPQMDGNKELIKNVFGAAFAEPLYPAASGVSEMHAAKYMKALFQSLNTYCGMLLGQDDQQRLFYLNDDHRLVPFENSDVYDVNNQKAMLKMLMSNRLFAIPAGETTPVQVQLQNRENPNSICFADNLGCPPKEPPVNRFFARWFGNGRDQVNAYKAALEQSARAVGIRKEIDRITNLRLAQGFDRRALTNQSPIKGTAADTEMRVHRELALGEEQTQAALRRFDVAETEHARQEELARARAERGHEAMAFDSLQDIYGAKPVFRQTAADADCYSDATFHLLKSVDCRLLPSGTPLHANEKGFVDLTEEAFTAVAVGAAILPGIGKKVLLQSGDQMGELTEKAVATEANLFCEGLSFDTNSNMIRNDLIMHLGDDGRRYPRQMISRFFKSCVQPAREAAASAVTKYQQGDRQPLAHILARSLMEFEHEVKGEGFSSVARRTMDKVYTTQVKLLEEDPALKRAVREEIAKIQKTADDNLKTYEATRKTLRTENPDFDKMCELRVNNQERTDEYKALAAKHKDFPDKLIQDGAVVLNTVYAKQEQHFDLDETIKHVHCRQKVGAIYAEAQLARENLKLAHVEKRALSTEEKQGYLKAVLKAEVLLRHHDEFQRQTEENPEATKFQDDSALKALESGFGMKEYQLQTKISTDMLNYKFGCVAHTANTQFSPLYKELGRAENASAEMEKCVNLLISPAAQEAICAKSDEEFMKDIEHPCNLLNQDNEMLMQKMHEGLERTNVKEEFYGYDGEPVPDEQPNVSMPM